MQRHHLLPRALLERRAFAALFAAVHGERRRFDDFRENGLLLPCRESTALRLGLPLHRGPHRRYSELVNERMAQIEGQWRRTAIRQPRGAALEAQMRLQFLRRALRRLLLTRAVARPLLNRLDPLGLGLGPLGQGIDFTELDAVADALWEGTAALEHGALAPLQAGSPAAMPVRPRRSAAAA